MTNLSDDDSEDSDGIWQQVPKPNVNKRRLTKSPNMHLHKKFNLLVEPSTSKQNQFQLLAEKEAEKENHIADKDVVEDNEEDQSPNPPPIYVPNVTDISKMVKNISKEICSTNFNYKSVSDNQIRLMIKNVVL